jgi:hypothetical protein
MRDGALPAVLLCLAFGMAICRQRVRDIAAAIVILVVVAIMASALVFPDALAAPTAIAAAALTVLVVFAVYSGRAFHPALAAGLGVAAGALIGALTSFAGQASLLLFALPATLVAFPAAWLAHTGRAIALKVMASWILAVSLLSIGLTFAQGVSAGSDHLD